jgi:putative addiction module component (TIGR02574 family)
MNKPLQQIAAEALLLSPEDRESLLEILLSSLTSEAGYDEAWNSELERRLAAIEDGTAELIPGETVFARLKSAMK